MGGGTEGDGEACKRRGLKVNADKNSKLIVVGGEEDLESEIVRK